MPTRAGRLTPMEKRFSEIYAKVSDATYAAEKAGYSHPSQRGSELAAKEAIREATFANVQRFLRDQGAAIGVYTLAELAVDKATPAGVRRAAAADLAKLSGVGVSDDAGGKEPHEMSLDEIRRHREKLERQIASIDRAISDQAKPVIDHEKGIFD